MKRIVPLLFCTCIMQFAFAQSKTLPTPKLSPLTRQYIQAVTNTKTPPQGFLYKKLVDGKQYVSAIIKVADASAAESGINAVAAHIGTRAGDIWTVQVPYDRVVEFSRISGIAYIQIDEPVEPTLNVARKTTRVDSVHGGYNLPMPYTGDGVVLGIIDFGFDYTHPTMYDTLGGAYRVRKVWELNGTGTPPTGYLYGSELADSNAIKAQGTDNAKQIHGTCVAGMAGGSGYGSVTNNRFRGMAFRSDMVFVGVRRDSIEGQWQSSGFSDFLDGVNYIFSYATSVGKPCVVNISWGSQSGPHDGTSLFNQACDNMTGPGKIVVLSAGNEGEERLHIFKGFSGTDTTVSSFLNFSQPDYKRTWIDTWGDTGKTFCANVTMYHNGVAGASTGFICIDDNIHDLYLMNNNGIDTCYTKFITSSSEFNNKPRLLVDIFNKGTDSILVTLKGNDGTIDSWNESYYYGFPHHYFCQFDSLGNTWAVNGNNVSTTSDMGSAHSAILVGAYASKIGFININNQQLGYGTYVLPGGLVPFSSRGPSADGRVKPDITAPGLTIATAVSSFDTSYTQTGSNNLGVISKWTNPATMKDYYYSEFSGTSASAPATSGIVALMLQANPNLTPQLTKDIINLTAIHDANTGTIGPDGNNNWGHGKINAYGAVKYTIQHLNTYTYSGRKLDCTLFPNPSNGIFTVDYTGAKEEDLTVNVLNLAGAVVNTQSWHVSSGANFRNINVSSLPKGTYVVNVVAHDGAVNMKAMIN